MVASNVHACGIYALLKVENLIAWVRIHSASKGAPYYCKNIHDYDYGYFALSVIAIHCVGIVSSANDLFQLNKASPVRHQLVDHRKFT